MSQYSLQQKRKQEPWFLERCISVSCTSGKGSKLKTEWKQVICRLAMGSKWVMGCRSVMGLGSQLGEEGKLVMENT